MRAPRHESQLSLLRNVAWPISVPDCVANRQFVCRMRLCSPRGHDKLSQLGDSVARCIRAPRGGRSSAVSTAPCFPSSVAPRPWECPVYRGNKILGSPPARADRKGPLPRQRPRLDHHYVPGRPPTPSQPLAYRLPPTSHLAPTD